MKGYSVMRRLCSLALAVWMVIGIFPITALSDSTGTSWPIGEVTTAADPDTASRLVNLYGSNTQNAGKVTVDKSVSDSAVTLSCGGSSQTFTPEENHFIVSLSQTSQVMGLMSKSSVPLDVVFILDTSGSMNKNGVNRASSMVTAANSAIKTLMAANEYNRIAVVAFSSEGYGDGTSNDEAASVLSSLAHYTGDAATAHLQWVNSQGGTTGSSKPYIAGRDTGTITVNQGGEGSGSDNQVTLTVNAFRHGYNGGTNIQAGIIKGAKLLTSSSNDPTVTTENGTVTRMPFIVILSDGQPTFSYSNSTWYAPTSTGQQGDGNTAYAGNGFLPALTAAYYKGVVTEKYYGTDASENNRCSIYTIGVQLNEELAEITLNPRKHLNSQNKYSDTFLSYWSSFIASTVSSFYIKVNRNSNYQITAATVRATRDYINGRSSTGKVMYTGGLAYNDEYFAATDTADIAKAFRSVVNSIQKKAVSMPTQVDPIQGEDFSGYVTITDPIGEYMEVKNMYGILASGNWYQGKLFARHVQSWSTAPQEFRTLLTEVMEANSLIADPSFDMDTFIAQASASPNQAYYRSDTDYDNSVVWWGRGTDATEDEKVQYLGFADNDTVAYIEENQAAIQQLGADYVCRSYFFYGTADNTAINPNHQYLYFVVRLQRSLTAPYQQTVVVSIPASLLSAETVMITEAADANGNTVFTASVTKAEPARVVYEVGLRSDINAFNVAEIMAQDSAYLRETGEFTFYTNDWNRSADGYERAMTKATFRAAPDNEFYAYQENTLIYVKNGEGYVPYTGTAKPVGSDYYYGRTVYDWSGSAVNEDGSYHAVKKTVYIPVSLPDSDGVFEEDGQWFIAKGIYKASSLTGGENVYKTENKTQTSSVAAYPRRSFSANHSHYTVYLGNNGKLTLKSLETKHVSVNLPDNTVMTDDNGKVVMVGDELTYTLDVVNLSDRTVTADVTDTVPRGTEYVPDSATHGGQYADGGITWNGVPVAAGQTLQVSFKVTVTEAALSGDMDVATIDNAANVTLSNGFHYTTNTTQNPPEGKKVVGSDGQEITDGVQVPDVLVYRIRWYNDSGADATVTVTDVIPDGTTYVANSASHNGVCDGKTVTWTLENIRPGASGVVSFRVNVNAGAVEYIRNDASIKIGDNDPRQTNDTEVFVKTGSLVLTKTVQDNGYSGASGQTFILNLTEIGLNMNGDYVMLRGGVAETVTFTGGTASVQIRHGETLEIQGIPAGATIAVTEATKKGFTPSYTSAAGNSVTVIADGNVQVDVTNTYDPDGVTFQLEAVKVLTADVPVGNLTFGFTAYGCDGNGENLDTDSLLTGEVTVSGTNKEAKIQFAPVSFETEGTYFYLVSELNGGVTGVTYADDRYLVAVTVTDDGSGQLKASAELKKYDSTAKTFVSAASLRFVNSYAPRQTQLTLEADKVLTGRTLHAGEFSFLVTDPASNTVVSTGSNDDSGKITFRPITYTEAKTYSYVISEVNGGLHGVAYSTERIPVTVNVVDVNGQLVATPNYPDGGAVFTNIFTPDDITVPLEAKKVLKNQSGDSSRVLQAGEFSFAVRENNREVATGTNDAGGNIVFTPIGFTSDDVGKTFTYTVSEIIPDLSGNPYMDYDESVFTVTVSVSQDADGNLVPTVTYPDGGVVFTNIQYPNSVEITPVGRKTTTAINHNIPQNATFSFTVTDVATNQEAGGGVANANGDFRLSTMGFNQAGEYLYWIRETNSGTIHGITYDDTVYLMKVTVTLTNGKLEAEVSYYGLRAGGNPANVRDYTAATQIPSFRNTYDAKGQISVTARKVLTNLTLKEGNFAFKLIRQDNGQETAGVVSADGTIRFATLYFDLNDFASPEQTQRILHYKMSEVIPQTAGLPGVTYDDSVYDIYIKIVHDTATGTITAALTTADGTLLTDASGTEISDTGVVFTNRYAPQKGTSATISASKILENRDLRPGEFSFNLYRVDAQGTQHLVDTAVNDADGNIRFTRTYAPAVLDGADSITIHYVIREVNNHLNGVIYSEAAFKVKVTVTDNKDGTLSSTVAYEGGAQPVFYNTYQPAGTAYTPEASKILQNRDLVNGEFSFVITDENGKVVSTAVNDGTGKIVFSPIGYQTVGTYEYTVSEVKGNLPGVEYTAETYKLVVTVIDNTDRGTLEATGVYYTSGNQVTSAVFTNVYTPEDISVQLQAGKILTGRDMEDSEFSYVVTTLDGTVVATGGNGAAKDGERASVRFSDIGYSLDTLQGGDSVDLVYRIRELATTQGGVKFDTRVYYAWVNVSNNGALGKLEATVKGYYDSYNQGVFGNKISNITFRNTYAPTAAEATISAAKTLINKNLEAGEFTFLLQDASGNILQEKTNGANGNVTFDTIQFQKPGIYIYTVSEQVTDAEKADRYTLDDSFTVVVTVEDNLKGNLNAAVSYHVNEDSDQYTSTANMGAAEFINYYTAPPITEDLSLAIGATKSVTAPDGITYSPEGFRFHVVDIQNNPVATGISDANGNIKFTEFTFNQAGAYHYLVYEDDTEQSGILKDSRTWDIHILVRYDEQTGLMYIQDTDVQSFLLDGAGTQTGKPAFVNVYQPKSAALYLTAAKKLTGRDLEDGEFSFQVRDSQGNLVSTGKNTENGEIQFPKIELSAVGTYTFTVTEVKGSNVSITYDETVFTVIVNVTNDNGALLAEITYPDNGIVFENVYEKYDPNNPDTGDHSNTVMYLVILTVSLMGLAAVVLVMKKRYGTAR